MHPSALRRSLEVLNVVAALTLARSLLFERWFTVMTASLLLVGASAALRSRTWGIGLAFGAATTFVVAGALGIGPAWFGIVGVLGALPFALTYRSLARFDAGATLLGAGISSLVGAMTAWLFALSAPALFRALPMIAPAWTPSPGGALALLGVSAAALVASKSSRARAAAERSSPRASLPQIRVAPHSTRPPEPAAAEDDGAEMGTRHAANAARVGQ